MADSKINQLIGLSVALFVLVLIISAWFDASIRVLHVFEALPYCAVPWLCRRKPKAGYSLGFASGAFWLWTAGFLTTFIRNGFERIVMLAESGSVDRPDILLAVPGFMGTLGLVVFSLIGYFQLQNKKWNDILLFLAMLVLVFLFFILIFALFTPHYLQMFGKIFR